MRLGSFDSAPLSAVSRDKSVRRSAQDDVFVVSWRCKKQRLLGFLLPAKQCSSADVQSRLQFDRFGDTGQALIRL